MNDGKLMLLAIAEGRKGIAAKQSPFGAVIAKNGKVISAGHNTVLHDCDSTKHAEINAISKACRKMRSPKLKGCAIYSTCEPCPMCFAAIHWAEIGKIVFGASISDAKNFGFHELAISNSTMKRLGKDKIKIQSGFLKSECLQMMEEWKKRKDKRTY
ncbi:MAG: nucleoside deaminase [Candidatus Micrarchaeota archaeon]